MTVSVAIVGLGGMGAAAAQELAARGARVVGFDLARPPHGLGSTHGGSRVARVAYFEHADYVPLLRSAFEGWDRLERDGGRRCLHRCGVLLLGGPESEVLSGSRASAAAHGIRVEEMPAGEIRHRWPVFRPPGHVEGLLEPEAGFVVPEHGVRSALELAARHGADLRFDTPVRSIDPRAGGVSIRTDREAIEADRVVVTAGPWTSRLLPTLAAGCPLSPQRKVIVWCRPRAAVAAACGADRLPAWLYDDGGTFGDGVYYGVPAWPGQNGGEGMKLGFHGPGPVVDPDAVDREVASDTLARWHRDVDSFLPGVLEPPHASATCLYTMTSDQHFVIDRLPDAESIVVAAGFSGHGYKFAPVVGEILADLALEGTTRHPAEFLTLARRP